MSQAGTVNISGSGGGGSPILTLTGNTGGPVSSTANNINIVGSGTTTVTGTPGTSTLTISTTSSFIPNSIVNLQDDFIGTTMSSTADTALNSDHGWVQSFMTNVVVLDNGHPGNISNAGFTNGQTAYMKMGYNSGVPAVEPQIILGGGVITLNWVFNIAILSNVTNTYTLKIGMLNGVDNNGFYFAYSNALNSGNWTINTISAGSPTTTNTAIPVTTGWHNAQMVVNAAASSIAFTIDGVSVGSIATTIPTVKINPGVTATCSAGTIAAQSFYYDLMYLNQVLTVAR